MISKNTINTLKPILFQCRMFYSIAEFDVKSDFAIKHDLRLSSDRDMVNQRRPGALQAPSNERVKKLDMHALIII